MKNFFSKMVPKIRYKIGQKVRIKPDLKENQMYGNYHFVPKMKFLIGKIVTIYSVTKNGNYNIYEDNKRYIWTNEMFDGIDNDDILKIKQKFLK